MSFVAAEMKLATSKITFFSSQAQITNKQVSQVRVFATLSVIACVLKKSTHLITFIKQNFHKSDRMGRFFKTQTMRDNDTKTLT